MTQMLHLKIMQHFLHVRQINEIFIDEVNHLYIAILMYNLIEYSNIVQTHQDVYTSLKEMIFQLIILIWLLIIPNHLNIKQILWQKHQIMLIQTPLSKIQKIVVTLKYLSNFRRLLEIPLMNCKIHLDLNFVEGCVLSNAGYFAKFKMLNYRC